MPTLASAAKIEWEDRVIGGNWIQPGDQGKNRMPIRYNGQRREVEMAVRLFTRDVLQAARLAARCPLRWEGFRAWAQSPTGRQQCAELSVAATTRIAAAARWWSARHLPKHLAEELRRRRFRVIRRAPLLRPAAQSTAGAAPSPGVAAAAGAQDSNSLRLQRAPSAAETPRGSESSDGEIPNAAEDVNSPLPKRRRARASPASARNSCAAGAVCAQPEGGTRSPLRPTSTGGGPASPVADVARASPCDGSATPVDAAPASPQVPRQGKRRVPCSTGKDAEPAPPCSGSASPVGAARLRALGKAGRRAPCSAGSEAAYSGRVETPGGAGSKCSAGRTACAGQTRRGVG